jgi:hypothetical protein
MNHADFQMRINGEIAEAMGDEGQMKRRFSIVIPAIFKATTNSLMPTYLHDTMREGDCSQRQGHPERRGVRRMDGRETLISRLSLRYMYMSSRRERMGVFKEAPM